MNWNFKMESLYVLFGIDIETELESLIDGLKLLGAIFNTAKELSEIFS